MEYGPIPVSQYGEVIEHLRCNFFPDEPLNKSVGLCRKGEPHPELEAHSYDTLKDELSVMAVDVVTGQIAGVALNGILHRGDIAKAQEKLKTIDDKKFCQIFSLLYQINQRDDLFTQYKIDEIFECRIVSVDSKYRGCGIAKQLFLRSELIAEEYGFKIFKVDATSYFTQKASESMGLTTVQEIRYGDYKDEKGRPLFPTSPPHEKFKLMIKLLSPPPNSG